MGKNAGVLFVLNELVPGGAEHVLIDLVTDLSRRGVYRPMIACLKDRGTLAATMVREGIAVRENLLNDKYDYRVILRLADIIRREGVKIIVAVGSGGDRMFWSTLSAVVTGIKCVVWSHVYSQPGHVEFELPNRVLYPFVDRFVALGERHRRHLSRFDKVPAGRITVIRNGIEVERFDHPEWRDRARSILGLADENVTAIGMIANLRDSKRHDVFITSAKEIVRHRRDVHFFIIGDGPNRANVQRWAQQSELLGQYLSLLGHRDDVARLLPGLDVVGVCSEYQECLSLTALQAMAAGVPVVSHFIGSMDEMITDNETGFFFDRLSSDAMAERVLEVIDSVDLRRQVAERAREQVKEKFTCARMTDEFVALFNDLLAFDPHRQIG